MKTMTKAQATRIATSFYEAHFTGRSKSGGKCDYGLPLIAKQTTVGWVFATDTTTTDWEKERTVYVLIQGGVAMKTNASTFNNALAQKKAEAKLTLVDFDDATNVELQIGARFATGHSAGIVGRAIDADTPTKSQRLLLIQTIRKCGYSKIQIDLNDRVTDPYQMVSFDIARPVK